MEKALPYIKRFFINLNSYIRAIARLLVWTVIFFFSGLQKAIFTRAEVSSVEMKLIPLKCDIEEVDENLAYIDKLCLENPDLVEMSENAYEEELSDGPYDDGEDGD